MAVPGKPVAILLGLLMVVSSLPVVLSSENGGPGAAARDSYIFVTSFEKTVEVQKGGRYFFSIGPDNKIAGMAVPAPDAGMPTDMVKAVNRAPDWVRGELMAKLREVSTYRINPGPRDRLAVADFDGDGLPDAVAGGYAGLLTVMDNIGTAFSPMLVHGSDVPVPGGTGNHSVAAGDLNGDGRTDLVVGMDDGSVWVYFNTPDGFDRNGFAVGPSGMISRAAPALGDLNNDGLLDLVVGDGTGKVVYYVNNGNRTHFHFAKSLDPAFAVVMVPGPACPALADLDGDGRPDLAVGGGNGAIHYFHNIGAQTVPAWAADDPLMFGGIQAASDAAPSFADFNGDNRTDLFVGEGTGTILFYENVGSSTAPKWESWPFYDAVAQAGYYPANTYVTYVNYSSRTDIVDALNTIEDRCVDELAFSIAHSAVEVLRQSPVGLFEENARSIYENDRYLDYVQVVDYANYSTTRYTVNESGQLRTYELPRDIYYWYVVMPKITDEVPLYIDPNATAGSPDERAPPPVGQFWRDYLFDHADPAYPPDPPNATARYPKTMTPPLLKDVLAGVTTLWNCTRFSSPGGFDNDGINNSHPFSYGDHAIEKISNWVMKTLPLNQQESGDSERPIQPVRIAACHNGNCGELQDLTVAAARACLIPAAGVSMLDEDHVWIEFYERGWHQWDNYWSDGGAVVDDFMNYWMGWGHRGGSGISLWRGDDCEFEVTSDYIPPVSQSHVTVNVRDANGVPVDGARVRMMSHWMAEHELPQPAGVTLPVTMPSLATYNFTDCSGSATFIVADNNFTVDVDSLLGQAVVNKTYIGEGENRVFNFSLPGKMPGRGLPVMDTDLGTGRQIAYLTDVLGAVQRPPNPQVLTTSVQPVNGPDMLDLYLMDASNFSSYLAGYDVRGLMLYPFSGHQWMDEFSANGTWYFVLSNERTLETYLTVHIKLDLYALHVSPGVVIDYPVTGQTIDGSAPIPVSGRVLNSAPISDMELSVDNGPGINITGAVDSLSGRWSWDLDLTAMSPGAHRLGVRVMDSLGFANSTSVNILLDKRPPQVFIDSPPFGAIFGLNDVLEFRGRATDDTGVVQLAYGIDGMPGVDLASAFSGGSWNFTHPAGTLGGGRHTLVVSARDGAGRVGNATTVFELQDDTPPELAITAPAKDEAVDIGGPVLFQGTAHDDSRIASLDLAIGQASIDLLPFRDSNGGWSWSWSTAGSTGPGEVAFTVTARDDSGNRATASWTFRLVDASAPSVELLRPANGTVFRTGNIVTVNGTASDNLGIVRLEIRLGTAGWKSALSSLRGDDFSCTFDTTDLPEGRCNITVRAFDSSDNAGVATGYINIEKAATATPAKKKTTSFLPGMELATLLAAAGTLALAQRSRRTKED